MNLIMLIIAMLSCGVMSARAFTEIGWKRAPVTLGFSIGLFLSSLWVPWFFLKHALSAQIFTAFAAVYAFYLSKPGIWDRFSLLAGRNSDGQQSEEVKKYGLKALVASAVTIPPCLFVLITYQLVPMTGWDTLWYWAPLAIDLLSGGQLPISGHPSFGAYSLAFAANESVIRGIAVAGFLTFVQATCAISAVSLLTRHGKAAPTLFVNLYLCMSLPMMYQTYFNVGYFDLHIAVCILFSLVLLIDMQMDQNLRTNLMGITFITVMLSTALTLKTTAMLPVACFICAALSVIFKPRFLLILGAATGLIVAYSIQRGFHFLVLGREFSIDWDRNPPMIVPGLWQDIFHDASIREIFENFFTAFLVNQSYSLAFIGALAVLLLGGFKEPIKIDLRVQFLVLFIYAEFMLQMVVPYFFENAVMDKRFTRSMLIVPLLLVSLFAEAILRIRNDENLSSARH